MTRSPIELSAGQLKIYIFFASQGFYIKLNIELSESSAKFIHKMNFLKVSPTSSSKGNYVYVWRGWDLGGGWLALYKFSRCSVSPCTRVEQEKNHALNINDQEAKALLRTKDQKQGLRWRWGFGFPVCSPWQSPTRAASPSTASSPPPSPTKKTW